MVQILKAGQTISKFSYACPVLIYMWNAKGESAAAQFCGINWCLQTVLQTNLFKSELVRFLSCLRCKPYEFFHKPNTDSPFTSHLSGGTFPTLSGGTLPTLFRGTFSDPQTLLSSISLSLKKREMHQIADTATRMYTILESTAVWPPKINATRSKLKIPTSPQFIPPIISRVSAILSSTVILPFCGDICVLRFCSYYWQLKQNYTLIFVF